MNKVYLGDCLEIMDILIKDNIKFDAIITDLPYGITSCKWDMIIDFDQMWSKIALLRKNKCPVILFGSEPFSSRLRVSNIKEYKYDWIWNKKQSGNPFLTKKQPLKIFEIISVFYPHNYYPIMRKGKMRKKGGRKRSKIFGNTDEQINNLYYPVSIIEFPNCLNKKGKLHPTQKSVDLMEYLIQTYTLKNDLILDFAIGSGTTAIACLNTNRQYIGVELNEKYYNITQNRIKEHLWKMKNK